MAKLQPTTPWWLDPGTEICPSCKHLYLYETEYRCSDCDGPMCPDCVEVKSSVTVVCYDCVDAEESE